MQAKPITPLSPDKQWKYIVIKQMARGYHFTLSNHFGDHIEIVNLRLLHLTEFDYRVKEGLECHIFDDAVFNLRLNVPHKHLRRYLVLLSTVDINQVIGLRCVRYDKSREASYPPYCTFMKTINVDWRKSFTQIPISFFLNRIISFIVLYDKGDDTDYDCFEMYSRRTISTVIIQTI